jgi:hypothetical protein
MKDFFWASGHLGWGIFSLAVFTVLWWLLADLVWRVKNVRISRLAIMMSAGWILGAGLIVLGSCLGSS